MLVLAMFLGNPFTKGDHLPLGEVSPLSSVLGPIYNLVGWVGFLNAQCA